MKVCWQLHPEAGNAVQSVNFYKLTNFLSYSREHVFWWALRITLWRCWVFLKAVSTWQEQTCSNRILFIALFIILMYGRYWRLRQVVTSYHCTVCDLDLALDGIRDNSKIPLSRAWKTGLYNTESGCVSSVCDRLAVFNFHITGRGWYLLYKIVREWNPCISGFISEESIRLVVWKDGSNRIFCVVKIYVNLKPMSSFPILSWKFTSDYFPR